MAGVRAFSRSGLLMFASVAALAVATDAVHAQDDPAGADIVVTAQKRSERMQDVPISLSVLGKSAIETQHFSQADDIAARIPNLQFSATVGENTPIFSLRGVSMSDFSLNQAGPVATYYDEVYKGNFAFLGVQLFDLERVEVLRGPQGTLYGKNTTGGAINLISRAPVMRNEGYVQAGIGNYGRWESNGAANVVLGDKAAVRIAYTVADADGWFRNRLPGQPDLNGTREYGIRGTLLVEPSDWVRLTLRLSTSRQSPTNYGSYSVPGADGVGAGAYEAYGDGTSYFRTGLGRREIEAEYVARRRARTWSAALTGQFDLADGLSLTSITAWDKGSLFVPEDTDGSPTQALEIPYTDRARQFSQDLRLTSDWDGPLNFILGGYFHREAVFNSTVMNFWTDLDVTGDGTVNGDDCAANDSLLACVISNRFDQLKHSYAVYGDVRYTIGDRTTLRGGLRFTRDDGHQNGLLSEIRGVDGTLFATPIPGVDRSYGTRNLSGKFGIDHKLVDGTLLFASYSRGYRASGFNAQAYFDVSEANVAAPEKIDAFEGGVKTQFADRAVSLSATGFYYIYRNQQFLSVDPDNAAQNLVNLDRSRIYGAEVEIDARPHRDVGLQLALGLLDAKARKGVISGVDVSGHRLSNAPKVTLSSAAEVVAFDNGDARLTLNGNMSYVSGQYFEIMNIARLRQGGYALLGANAALAAGPWTVSVWGKNLTDKVYFTSRIDLSGFGFDYNHIGTPRTFGATVRYGF